MGGGGGWWSGRGWGQGGCKRRIEVFVKILGGGGGRVRGGVMVDVNEELKFL